MGISEIDLKFIAAMGEWPKRVCDLGDQDLLCYSEADFDSLGVNSPRRGKAREFWRAVGADCMTLDVVGETTRFDLNTDKVPPEWGQFDLVTNAGDTEHVFNQVNCFTAIHDLTRVGGVMYHQLPVAGSTWHGLFVYSLKFFRLLAQANHYDVLQARVDFRPGTAEQGPPSKDDSLDALHAQLGLNDASLRVLMRRTRKDGFAFPLDIPQTPSRLRVWASKVKHAILDQS